MSSFTSPLIVSPLPDGRTWKLARSFTYHVGNKRSRGKIKVPAGFITDFASVPRLTSPIFTLIGLGLVLAGYVFWGVLILTVVCALSWFREWGKHGKAAVLHDWLYRTKTGTRKNADTLFREAMIVGGTRRWRATMMYWSVRIFGWMAWHTRHTS